MSKDTGLTIVVDTKSYVLSAYMALVLACQECDEDASGRAEAIEAASTILWEVMIDQERDEATAYTAWLEKTLNSQREKGKTP